MKKTKTKTKIKSNILFIALAFSLMSGIFFLKVQAAPDSTLYFNPSSNTVIEGDDFTLDAMIDPGTNSVGIVELDFTFDQTKLRLDGITEGADWEILTTIEIDNNNGTASVDLYIPFSDPYLTSISTMATLSFHALATATDTSVAYTAASQAAADGETGDVVSTREPALITVNINDVASPTFTINDGVVGSYVQSDAINVTVTDASGIASQFYGYSSDSTCNASDDANLTNAFTSGVSFSITGNHTDYLCLKATDSSPNANVSYQLVGQLYTDNTSPTFNVVNGTSATSVQTDIINVTVADTASGVATRTYGFSSDSTCNASDTITTAFTSGTNFNIAGDYSSYLCVRATDSAGNITYQTVGQLHTDNTSPTVAQVSAVSVNTYDTTPSYTFSSNEGGTIAYAGGCSSATTSASSGNNAVTFATLAVGNYNSCTIRVTDTAGNLSNLLTVSAFAVTYVADLDSDHDVDGQDFIAFRNYYVVDNAVVDFNKNGEVDIFDFIYLRNDFGKSF